MLFKLKAFDKFILVVNYCGWFLELDNPDPLSMVELATLPLNGMELHLKFMDEIGLSAQNNTLGSIYLVVVLSVFQAQQLGEPFDEVKQEFSNMIAAYSLKLIPLPKTPERLGSVSLSFYYSIFTRDRDLFVQLLPRVPKRALVNGVVLLNAAYCTGWLGALKEFDYAQMCNGFVQLGMVFLWQRPTLDTLFQLKIFSGRHVDPSVMDYVPLKLAVKIGLVNLVQLYTTDEQMKGLTRKEDCEVFNRLAGEAQDPEIKKHLELVVSRFYGRPA